MVVGENPAHECSAHIHEARQPNSYSFTGVSTQPAYLRPVIPRMLANYVWIAPPFISGCLKIESHSNQAHPSSCEPGPGIIKVWLERFRLMLTFFRGYLR